MDQHAKAGRQGRLTRIKLSDQIAEDLRRRIARDGLGPGDRLPHERALMEHYGCSKGSIREALKALEAARAAKAKDDLDGHEREGE